MDNQKRVTEHQVQEAVERAWKETLRQIESGPARTILEPSNNKDDISEQTSGEIMAWLFRRRDDNDGSGKRN